MRSKLAVIILLGVGLVFALLFGRQIYLSRGLNRARFEAKKLRVLTYSTFVSATGPGGAILDRFKKDHDCELDVQVVGDAGLLVERQRLEPFDVVIGLDGFMLPAARTRGGWKTIDVSHENWQAPATIDPSFVAFDWSPMTFIYREGLVPPQRLEDLLAPRFKGRIALQDPHASSPGLQFWNWVRAIKGERSGEFLAQLKANAPTVAPSWAFSYGLFKKRQVDLVFSYLTSLAFHWGIEKDRSYRAASFAEGHPVQVEFAGVPENCQQCELATAFVRTLLEPWAQTLIMQKNFMLPVIKGLEGGTVFAELPALKLLPTAAPGQGQDLSEWDKVFQH